MRQQGQPGPSSNGAAAAIAPKESWSSDDADFQDVPQELPACQQDEFEDAQPEHLSPSECTPIHLLRPTASMRTRPPYDRVYWGDQGSNKRIDFAEALLMCLQVRGGAG